MSSDETAVADEIRPDAGAGAGAGAPEPESGPVRVTSDLRGVSWQEQECLTFGTGGVDLRDGDEPAPALEQRPPSPDPGEAAPRREGSSWSFGGPPRSSATSARPVSWSFGGPPEERPHESPHGGTGRS